MAIGDKDNRAPRPLSDFDIQLTRQLKYLRASCALYDAGEHDEAVRMALVLRVLLHQPPKSKDKSLLNHLGMQNRLDYVDTGVYRSLLMPALQAYVAETSPGMMVVGSGAHEVGLVEQGDAGNGRVGWYAPLRLLRYKKGSPYDKATPGVSKFTEWWNNPLVETTEQKSFSRKNLVLIMCNQDGGSHVDDTLDADYSKLIIDPMGGAALLDGEPFDIMTGDIPDILHNVAFASVRQIAFEFLCTMDRYFYVKANPGALLQADPFKDLAMPTPPHRAVYLPIVLTIGKIE